MLNKIINRFFNRNSDLGLSVKAAQNTKGKAGGSIMEGSYMVYERF